MLDLEVKKSIATEYIQKKDFLKWVKDIDESFAALTWEIKEWRATKKTREALEDFLVSESLFEWLSDSIFKKNFSAMTFLSEKDKKEIEKAKKTINKGNIDEKKVRTELWLEIQDDQTTTETPENPDIVYPIVGWELLLIDNVPQNKEKFSEKVKKISEYLNINPNRLMWVMNKESWFNHQIQNKKSWATWLIQFMPETAKWLGTTTEKLKNMTNIKQLNFVKKYYKPYKDKIKSYQDLYLATLYPFAIGKPDDYILWSENNRAGIIWRQNNMNDWKPISVAHVKTRLVKWVPENYIAQFETTENTQVVA